MSNSSEELLKVFKLILRANDLLIGRREARKKLRAFLGNFDNGSMDDDKDEEQRQLIEAINIRLEIVKEHLDEPVKNSDSLSYIRFILGPEDYDKVVNMEKKTHDRVQTTI